MNPLTRRATRRGFSSRAGLWRRHVQAVAAMGVLAAAVSTGWGWHAKGHDRVARRAVAALDADAAPAFLRAGAEAVAAAALEPDVFTRPIAPAALHAAESPEHYIDLEPLGEAPLPATRAEMLAWCHRNNLEPAKVGLAPYAIVEWTQRLTVALAEHRRWSDDPHIRAKCLLYAGMLAHYAADVCQPLHTTVHYDGRLKADGSSPRSGIHLRVDALLGKLHPDAATAAAPARAEPFDKVFEAVVAQVRSSHALVDRVYELEKDLPAYEAPLPREGPVADFARQRLETATVFTARLLATAWRDSAGVTLPDWHDRPPISPDVKAAQRAATAPASAPAPAPTSAPAPAAETPTSAPARGA